MNKKTAKRLYVIAPFLFLAFLIFLVIFMLWGNYYISGNNKLCEERGFNFWDCPSGELKCQDACKEFNLDFYKFRGGCWCIYEGLPKQIY